MTLTPGALEGLKVVEMGQLIAGPFAGKTLGDFGAEVIKIEAPGTGDPLRNWRLVKDGTSVWWQVQSRNKRSIALDLRSKEGQDIARRLIARADVLIENFRPGTLEGWGMSYDELSTANPGLIMLRISGYGQTGPYRDLPGFGLIGEAMGGLRHMTGEPGRVPVRVGVVAEDREVLEIEPRAHGAAGERVIAERTRGLPMRSCDRAHGRVLFEPVAREATELRIDREHFERATFVQMPDFVRGDAVPAADDAGWQQEVDSRERRACATAVSGRHQVRGAEYLPIEATFGMRLQIQLLDQFCGARVHENGDIPHLFVTIVSESSGGALSK